MTGFNDKWSGTSGTVPEFGAIFMSSGSTKKECLTRKLFGLPSSQASFVNQIKEGMILFLFEFEKRQLHGVFRASCDGALNIVSGAFSSSGKQFPAQVKFTRIWHCEPLSEHEFQDAIIDNYFSSKKFNFGLSKDQVHNLLLLFDARKLNHIPKRHSTRTNNKRHIQHSPSKCRKLVDDCRHLARDRAEAEHDLEKYHDQFYIGKSVDEVERVSDGGLARTGLDVYRHNSCVEPPSVQSNPYQGNYPRNFERVDDDWPAATGRVQTEYSQSTSKAPNVAGIRRVGVNDDELRNRCNVEKGIIEQDISTNCYPTLSRSGYSANPNLEGEITFKDQLMSPSTIFHPVQLQFSNYPHLNYGEDAVVRNSQSCHSTEPLFPTLSYSTSHQDALVRSSQSRHSIEPRLPTLSHSTSHQDAIARNYRSCHSIEPLFPTLSYSTSRQDAIVTNSKMERPFSNIDGARTVSYNPDDPGFNLDVSSSVAARHSSSSAHECAPLDSCGRNFFPPMRSESFFTGMEPNTSLKNNESSYRGNEVPFSIASVPEKRSTDFSENDGYSRFSFPKPSLGTVLYSERGNRGVDDKECSSYSLNPSCKNKSLMFSNFGYRYPDTLHDVYEKKNEVPLCENREVLTASIPFSNSDECWKPDYIQFAEPGCVDCHERVSLNSGFTNSQDSQNMISDSQKKRNSVFSRLSLAPQVYEEENSAFDNVENDMDLSIDEIMTLSKERAKKSWVVTKKFNDDDETIRKKQKISFPKVEKDCVTVTLKDTRMNITSTEEKIAEETPFLNFKRRSQVQKINEEPKSRGCVESTDDRSSSGLQHKRRRLIRPNFSKIVSSDDKLANDVRDQNLQSSVIEETNVILGDTEVNDNSSSHQVDMPHKACSISCEDKSYNMEAVGLNCEVEGKAEMCDGSLENELKMKHHPKALSCKVCPVESLEEIQRQNADTEISSFEQECGEATTCKILLQEVENSNKPCPINGEIIIDGLMIKSSNLNLDSENIPERISNVSVNEECKETSMSLSLLPNNKQCRTYDESVRFSPGKEIFDGSKTDTEVLETANEDGNHAMTIVQSVENRNELIPSIQLTSWKKEAVLSSLSPKDSDGNEVTENVRIGEIVQTANGECK